MINIDCDDVDKEMFTDQAVLEQLHPKVRRNLKSWLKLNDQAAKGKDRTKMKAAQLKLEKDRVMTALADMDGTWRTYVEEALVQVRRTDLSDKVVPRVGKTTGGQGKAKTGAQKKNILKKQIERGIPGKVSWHRSPTPPHDIL